MTDFMTNLTTAFNWLLTAFLGLLVLYIAARLVTSAYFRSRSEYLKEKAKTDGV